MSFEEEFDSIIRRKAEEEQYPFDENNWAKASKLLDVETKAVGGLTLKRVYLPAIFLLTVGSAVFVAFNYFGSTKDSNQSLAVIAEPIAPVERAEVNETNAVGTNAEPATNEQILKNELNSVEIAEGTSSNIKANVPLSAKKAGEARVSANNSTKKISEPLQTIVKSVAPESTSAMELPVIVQNSTTEPIAATDKNNQNNAGSKTPESSIPANIVAVESPVVDQNNVSGSKEVLLENEKDEVQLESVTVNTERLNAVYSMLPYQMNELDLMPTTFNYLSRYDDDYYVKTETPKKHYLNIEAGGNYLLGWDTKNGKDGEGLNWFGGFNYGFYLSRKVNVSFGIQAYNISNIKQPFYLISSREYGFGSTDIYTRVTTNQLYYVALPLKFNYALNVSNTIGVGVNAGYLVGANNTVSKFYVLDNEEKALDSPESHNKGAYKGTNMVNMMLSVHYKTQFCKRFGLNLEFNYGLTDIFENTGDIKTVEKPMGIRVGLIYTLFDK